MAKTRLAPVKQKLTIPKMELVAVTLGSRLARFVASKLHLPLANQFLWTDSQCVLCWINSKQGPQRFVQSRIDEITSCSSLCFRYVPSEINPADIPTKGARTQSLRNNLLWWNGPGFLRLNVDKWPAVQLPKSAADGAAVVTAQLSPATTTDNSEINRESDSSAQCVIDEERYASLTKLLHVTSYVFRFVNRLTGTVLPPATSAVTKAEMISALQYWVRRIQHQHFRELVGVADLSKQRIVAQMDLFWDSDDVIRCRGRIDRAAAGFEAINPALLPKHCHFTELVIMFGHREVLHAGVAETLARLRQRFWIVHGRSAVKKTLRACRTCRQYEGGSLATPNCPPLPLCRMEEGPPFTCSGVDFLGPLGVQVNTQSLKKAWICLFTCAVVRAVHLEVVEDLSTGSFLLALRRFIAVHGCPSILLSDNGRQFHMAAGFIRRKVVRFAESSEFRQFSSNRGLEWRFIVEMAPWMGGMYERLVGAVKKSLRKCLGSSRVTLVELQTIAAEITAVINSRPLTYVENDVDSFPITPMQLLAPMRGKTALSLLKTPTDPPYGETSSSDSLVGRWKTLQGAVSNFWRGWKSQYLLSLRERRVSHSNRGCSNWEPRIGMVVHLKENSPRFAWRLGQIEELHCSDDGLIRSVTIRTSNKRRLRRPLRLVFPLELDAEESSEGIPDGNTVAETPRRSSRKAAAAARLKFRSQLDNNVNSEDDE